MKLLTKALRKELPGIGTTDGRDKKEIKVIVKFFHPVSDWTWYAWEFDGKDKFFGLVIGHEKEMGSFYLSELESCMVKGLPIERDIYFDNETVAEVMESHGMAVD